MVDWSVAYLVLFPTAIGYVTWAIALKRLPAGRAANFLYGVPPTATLDRLCLWLGEVPGAVGLIRRCDGDPRRRGRQCNAEKVTAGRGESEVGNVCRRFQIQALVYPVIVKSSAILIADDGGKFAQAAGMTVSAEIKMGSRRLPEYLLFPLVGITSQTIRQR